MAEFSLAREQEDRSKIRDEMETFTSWLIPLLSTVSMVLIVLMTLANVQERSYEIAILRTLGYRSRHIRIIGATSGYIISFLVGYKLWDSLNVEVVIRLICLARILRWISATQYVEQWMISQHR